MTGSQITQTFTPASTFYGGIASTFTSVPANAVAVDGRVYSIDLSDYRHTGLPSFREGVVSSREPSDQLFNPNGGWWRYRYDWSLGMGQKVSDLDDDVLGKRYDYSTGLNPWEENELKLQHSLEEVQQFATSGNVTTPIFTRWSDSTNGDFLIVHNGESAYVINSAGTSTALGGSNGVGLNGAYGGNNYVAHFTLLGSNGYSYWYDGTASEWKINKGSFTYSGGVQWTHSTTYTITPNTSPATLFQIVGSNLFVGIDATLYEFTDAGGLDAIYTHPDESFRWQTAFNIGSRIYVGGHGHEVSNLFSLTTTSTGALAIASQATVLPYDELLYGGFGYSGNAILWTNKGLRFATLGGDGSITYGKLITTNGPVTHAYAYGKHIFFNWETTDGKLQIGRAALDEFVDTLLPAYATDATADVSANVVGIFACALEDSAAPIVNGKPSYTDTVLYVYGDNHMLYKQSATAYNTTGYLTTGDIYFGTAENKTLGRVEVRFDALASGQSVEANIYDSETNTLIGTRAVVKTGAKELTLTPQGTVYNRCYLEITLNGNGSSTPVVRQWKMNSYPVAPSVQQWQVPLIIGTTVLVGYGEGTLVSYDPWTEIEHIRTLWTNRTVFIYTESTHAYRVRVDNFSVEPTKWDDSGKWLELVLTVQLISVE